MEEMDLLEYWEIIVKKRGLIALIFALTVLVVAAYSFFTTPIYQATAVVMVREQGSPAQLMFSDTFGGFTKNAAQNYVQIMKSRTVLEKVSKALNLTDPNLKSLERQLTIQPVQGSDILKVSMESAEPQAAVDFVNKLTEVFIDWNRHSRQEDQRNAREFIEAQLVTVTENLHLAEEELRKFKETEKALAPSQETIVGVNQLAALEADLSQVGIGITETQERIAQVRAKLAEQDETLISATTIAENRFVTEYRARLADLEISLSGAKEKYTERHPSVLALQAEIEDVKTKLAEQVERVVGTETRSINPIHRELYGSLISQEVELMALRAREEALRSLRSEIEKDLATLPGKELELARLMRDSKVLEELYVMLRKRNEETRIAEAMQSADVQVIDEAILPRSPIKPRLKLNIAIGGVLGLFLGVGFAFLLEFTDTTLKTKEEIELFLQSPVLGQIPDFDNDNNQKWRLFGFRRT